MAQTDSSEKLYAKLFHMMFLRISLKKDTSSQSDLMLDNMGSVNLILSEMNHAGFLKEYSLASLISLRKVSCFVQKQSTWLEMSRIAFFVTLLLEVDHKMGSSTLFVLSVDFMARHDKTDH